MYSKLISFSIKSPLKFLLIIFSLLVLKEIIFIQTFTNDVSPIADGFSEANTTRGGVFFHEKGITAFSGLPDINYGELLPKRGSNGYPGFKKGNSVAYTHYPPGPEYMAWLGFHIVGPGNFNLLRYLPILLSVIIGIFFIRVNFELVRGGNKGVIFVLMLILPPMYSNFMHGLHHQQYAFLMLQLQMSLAGLYITKSKNAIYLLFFFLLGFMQGYMTFDYAFLASLFIIPFYLFFHLNFSTLASIGLCSGIGFTLAHTLHFYQVVNYYGDFQRALSDFAGSAAHRAKNAASEADIPNLKYNAKEIGPFTVMKDYLYRVAGRGKYLSINLINFIWIILGLKFIKRITFKKGYSFEFEISGRDLLALFSAVIISSMWSLVMKQHAHIHGFIARHYYFCYYFCCLILITRTKRVE
jgi:hypothetical protein